ncbi:hypothetical protein TRVL_10022 [Trypanosoma vivax]|nr:hypothetical protein TRVL_10022 [Trypanosoma vivax]
MTSNAAVTQQSRSSVEAHSVKERKAAHTCTLRSIDEKVRHTLCQRPVRCYLSSLSSSVAPSATRRHNDQSVPSTARHPGRKRWQAVTCTNASLANTAMADGQFPGSASDSAS